MDSGETVQCSQCFQILDDSFKTPVGEKKPCPRCGSMRRTYVITVTKPGEVRFFGGEVGLTVSHTTDAIIADPRMEKLKPFVRRLVWTELPDAWMLEVQDENDVGIASGVGDNRDDAFLDMAEHAIPPEEPGPEPKA
jgi:hypothetical protein